MVEHRNTFPASLSSGPERDSDPNAHLVAVCRSAYRRRTLRVSSFDYSRSHRVQVVIAETVKRAMKAIKGASMTGWTRRSRNPHGPV